MSAAALITSLSRQEYDGVPVIDTWDRFIFYADRIRFVNIQRDALPLISPTLWGLIGHFKPRLWLLPNVRRVTIQHPDSIDTNVTLSVLGPEVVHLTYGHGERQLRLHLAALTRQCRGLRKLTLCHESVDEEALAAYIPSMRQLEELKAPSQSVSDGLLASLTHSGRVRVLELGSYTSVRPPLIKDTFQMLEEFSMQASQEDWIRLLDEQDTLPRLRKLSVVAQAATVQTVELSNAFFQNLALFASSASDIHVQMTGGAERGINCASLTTFRSCTSLKRLHVHTIYNLRFPSTSHLSDACRAWPHLESIYLNSSSTALRPNSVLAAFAMFNPHLRKISMPFVAPSDLEAVLQARPQKLRSLEVLNLLWTSAPSDRERMAILLFHHLPPTATIKVSKPKEWSNILKFCGLLLTYRQSMSIWADDESSRQVEGKTIEVLSESPTVQRISEP